MEFEHCSTLYSVTLYETDDDIILRLATRLILLPQKLNNSNIQRNVNKLNSMVDQIAQYPLDRVQNRIGIYFTVRLHNFYAIHEWGVCKQELDITPLVHMSRVVKFIKLRQMIHIDELLDLRMAAAFPRLFNILLVTLDREMDVVMDMGKRITDYCIAI